MSQIISRKSAREQNLIYYFTGKPCRKGHIEKHHIESRQCVQCSRDAARTYYAKKKQQLLTQ